MAQEIMQCVEKTIQFMASAELAVMEVLAAKVLAQIEASSLKAKGELVDEGRKRVV
jgi:hypothetical protein